MVGDAQDVKRWEQYRKYMGYAAECMRRAESAGTSWERREYTDRAVYWRSHATHLAR